MYKLGAAMHREQSASEARYSYYHRQEEKLDHYVVNSILPTRWLQLDFVFNDRPRRWLRTVRYSSRPPIGQGVASLLSSRKVVREVIGAFRTECQLLGIVLDPVELSFTQSDINCYEQYAQAARELARHIASGSGFYEWTMSTLDSATDSQ